MTLAEFAHIFNTQGHLHILWMALFYVSHLIGTKIPSMATKYYSQEPECRPYPQSSDGLKLLCSVHCIYYINRVILHYRNKKGGNP